jgi:hypothetical protein
MRPGLTRTGTQLAIGIVSIVLLAFAYDRSSSDTSFNSPASSSVAPTSSTDPVSVTTDPVSVTTEPALATTPTTTSLPDDLPESIDSDDPEYPTVRTVPPTAQPDYPSAPTVPPVTYPTE